MEDNSRVLVKYQTFWRRFFASFLDGLIFLPVKTVEAFIVFGKPTLSNVSKLDDGQYVDFSTLVIIETLNAILMYSYSIWMTGRFGQTVGKMATNVKIVSAKDETQLIGYRGAFLRDLPLFIVQAIGVLYVVVSDDISHESAGALILAFATLTWLIAELISMLTNPRRRAIHDFIAGSVVVKM